MRLVRAMKPAQARNMINAVPNVFRPLLLHPKESISRRMRPGVRPVAYRSQDKRLRGAYRSLDLRLSLLCRKRHSEGTGMMWV